MLTRQVLLQQQWAAYYSKQRGLPESQRANHFSFLPGRPGSRRRALHWLEACATAAESAARQLLPKDRRAASGTRATHATAANTCITCAWGIEALAVTLRPKTCSDVTSCAWHMDERKLA